MKPIIELQNVKKIYRLGEVIVPAVNGVSLKIERGECISIMGVSGSGKSTLMHIVGTLDIPTEGDIFIDGINILRLSQSEIAKIRGEKIGFIFQTFNLIPSLTALDNVMLPMLFQNIPRSQRKTTALQLLNRIGLGKRAKHIPSKLSGGERQRVAIARALVNDPEILLADEPTGNLDSKTGREILELILDFHKKGKTVIIITHDLEIAKRTQRVIKIKDGILVK